MIAKEKGEDFRFEVEESSEKLAEKVKESQLNPNEKNKILQFFVDCSKDSLKSLLGNVSKEALLFALRSIAPGGVILEQAIKIIIRALENG